MTKPRLRPRRATPPHGKSAASAFTLRSPRAANEGQPAQGQKRQRRGFRDRDHVKTGHRRAEVEFQRETSRV